MIPENINWVATLAITSIAEFIIIILLLYIMRLNNKPQVDNHTRALCTSKGYDEEIKND